MLVIRTTGIEDYLDGGEAFIKCLVMGPPSAGKTRSASFWPKPIFADCEKGRMSIADRQMPYGEILSTKDMDKMLEVLKDECRKPVRDRRWQTFVIDTADAYQRIVIQERLDAEKKESLSGWGDWGYLDAKMTQFIAKVMALPMNIVMNVHVKDSTVGGDDETKAVQTGFKLKGDLKDQIAADFDLVGYMGTYWEAEGGERVLKRGIQWHPEPTKPFLKDRSGQLPKWTPVTFTEDDFGNLFASLTSHLDEFKKSQEVASFETDEAITTAPQPPRAGGPVAPAATPRKAAAAPAKAAPKPAEATSEPPPTAEASSSTTPTPVRNVPAAPKPDMGNQTAEGSGATPAPQTDEAQATVPDAEPEADAAQSPAETAGEGQMDPEAVATALGGEVISGDAEADAIPTGSPGEQAGAEDVAQATQESSDTALFCGTGYEGGEPTAQGCGVEIKTTEEGGDQQAMLVEIAQLKTRSNLCNACFAAHRAASKK